MATNNASNNRYPSGILIGTSNVLMSDYNDGVAWTPTVSGSTSAGTGTYTIQVGYYSQVGNLIFATAQIVWTAHTGTGNLLVTNLPFACRNLANYNPESIVNTINIALPGGTSRTAIGSMQANTTIIDVQVTQNSGDNSPVALSATGEIHISIVYLK
jgi:hypothetical protein